MTTPKSKRKTPQRDFHLLYILPASIARKLGENFPLWTETIGAMRVLTRQNNRVFDVDGGQKCVRFEERSKRDGTIGIVKIDRIPPKIEGLPEKGHRLDV